MNTRSSTDTMPYETPIFHRSSRKKRKISISPAPQKLNTKSKQSKHRASHAKIHKSTKKGKHRYSLVQTELDSDDICHICQEWGDKPDYACESCFHAFHTNCIKEHIKNKNKQLPKNKKWKLSKADSWDICDDIGFNCANTQNNNNNSNQQEDGPEVPTIFEFIGESTDSIKMESITCAKLETESDKALKGRSMKWIKKYSEEEKQFYIDLVSNKKRKNKKSKGKKKGKNKNDTEFNYSVTRTYYNAYSYQKEIFQVGDDVEINLDEGPSVARIYAIFKDDDNKYAWVIIQWFWRRSEKKHTMPSDDKSLSELYFDANYTGEYMVDSINEKVMVVGSYKSLLFCRKKYKNKQIFWCTHGWDCNKNYPFQLESGIINNKEIAFPETCTPAINKRKSRLNNLNENENNSDSEDNYNDNSRESSINSNSTSIVGKKRKRSETSTKRSLKDRIEEQLLNATKKLMLSQVPDRLPCREREHSEIYQFMHTSIQQGGIGSGLYISGMPGTGKTATCRQIHRELKRLEKSRKLPKFEYHEINAMKLPTPHHAYTELYKIIFQQQSEFNKKNRKYCAPTTAAQKLEKYFSERDKNKNILNNNKKTKNKKNKKNNKQIVINDPTYVLLIDELDYLLTRKQNVIYNLFDWPTRFNSKLVVIGIANTMDLPERLIPRVSSRLGLKRIVFKAYNRSQLNTIIEDRLSELNIFSSDAIKYCASSVAGVSGDCRTALQICRRAVDISLKRVKQNGLQSFDIGDQKLNNNNNNILNFENDNILNEPKRKRRKLNNNNTKISKNKSSKMEIDDDESETDDENKDSSDESNDENENNLKNTNNDTGLHDNLLLSDDEFDNLELEYNLVILKDIKTAKQSFDKSNDMQIISTLSIFEKLFLTAIIIFNISTNAYVGTLDQYKRRLDTYIQTSLGGKKINELEMMSILDKLENIGLISTTFDRKDWKRWIRLNSQQDDVFDSLKQDNTCSKILANLQLPD